MSIASQQEGIGMYYFCFQAEDGIRYWSVTGVQTCVFFFSSRRRHTRLVSDWSSDVCSSDLGRQTAQVPADGSAAGGEDDGRCGVGAGHVLGVLTPGASPGFKNRSAFRLLTPGLRPGLETCLQISDFKLLVGTSSFSLSTNSLIVMTTCLFPAPLPRTATESASASRCPTTAMYGTLCVSASRIL